ncbi:hypothetical protein J2128_001603 [Methanomicrobium sp. W14]|uniref:hypothetical protein n=1 Tax=Methanomicrobium sp. W14 TaxID=2817839 RepID=UPI001AE56F49|nr:hypothetical protein [Methanomicrobium sp. W14]MBP2133649.1 hypothetical protein [Methanomicrobium sp. W14]
MGDGNKRRVYSLYLLSALILFMFLVSSSAAYQINSFATPGNGSEIISLSSSLQRIAWIGSGGDFKSNVSVSGKETFVAVFDMINKSGVILMPDSQFKKSLCMNEKYMAWLEDEKTGTDICVYNFSSKTAFRLHSAERKQGLVFGGDLLFWSEEGIKNSSKVMSLDPSSKSVRTVVENIQPPKTIASDGKELAFVIPGIQGDSLYRCSAAGLCSLPVCVEKNGDISSVYYRENNLVWFNNAGKIPVMQKSPAGTNFTENTFSFKRQVLSPFLSGENIIWAEKSKDLWQVRIYDPKKNLTNVLYSGNGKISVCSDCPDSFVWTEKGPDNVSRIYYVLLNGNRGDSSPRTLVNNSGNETVFNGISGKKIVQGESDWYSVNVRDGVKKIACELSWINSSSSLSVTLMGPDYSIQRYTKENFGGNGSSVCISIEKSPQIPAGKWTCVVLGDYITSEETYSFSWYDYLS